MFTGIIETQGIVDSVKKNGKNLELTDALKDYTQAKIHLLMKPLKSQIFLE